MSKLVVVKVEVEIEECNRDVIIGHNLFVVSLEEWQSFAPYLTDGSVYYDYCEHTFCLTDLYKSAEIIEADPNVIEFISKHGDDLPLTFFRKQVQQIKRQTNLSETIEKLKLLCSVETRLNQYFYNNRAKIVGKVINPFREEFKDTAAYLETRFEYNNSVPYIDENIRRCLMRQDEVCLLLSLPKYAFKISIAEIDKSSKHILIKVSLLHNENSIPGYILPAFDMALLGEIFSKVGIPETVCELSVFINSILSNSDPQQLIRFFTDYTKEFTGEIPELSKLFNRRYVSYEDKTDSVTMGCYYIMTESEGFDKLQGIDLGFFKRLCKRFKIKDYDFNYIVKEPGILYFICDKIQTCSSEEHGDSEDFGRCLNPEILVSLKEKHKCEKGESDYCTNHDVPIISFVKGEDFLKEEAQRGAQVFFL